MSTVDPRHRDGKQPGLHGMGGERFGRWVFDIQSIVHYGHAESILG